MAVLANGRIQLEGKPADLIAATRGQVWKKTIDHDRARRLSEPSYEVISTRLFAGRLDRSTSSPTRSPQGFEPVEGGLEDVYFSTLSTLRRAA